MDEGYAVTSIRLPSDLRNRFDALARAAKRTRSDLIVEAMTRYADAETAYLAAIQEGLDDVEAGRHRSLEDVTQEWIGRGVLSPTWNEEAGEDVR
jgi:predicted transcriptional regulator